MSSTVELLSTAERTALALWYDSESYRAFKHLLEMERTNTATKLIDVPPDDVVTIARHQGRADNCKQLHLSLKKNYQAYVRADEKKAKKIKP